MGIRETPSISSMSKALNLFDKSTSSGASSGNKQDAVIQTGAANSLPWLPMKLVQSKASNFMGGGNSGSNGKSIESVSRLFCDGLYTDKWQP